jgi:transcriptional regulator with XRE-family HTH domain
LTTERKSLAFSNWLTAQLAERGISRSELATSIDVTSDAVFKWLRGESLPSRGVCRAIAQYFGVPEHEVLELAGRA